MLEMRSHLGASSETLAASRPASLSILMRVYILTVVTQCRLVNSRTDMLPRLKRTTAPLPGSSGFDVIVFSASVTGSQSSANARLYGSSVRNSRNRTRLRHFMARILCGKRAGLPLDGRFKHHGADDLRSGRPGEGLKTPCGWALLLPGESSCQVK